MSMFSYPGPNPFTKEQAILMMADAVEAASRSLPEYTEESINGLVEKIVDGQVSDGYFKECPITFKDIALVKALFKEKLKTVYHTRITYPELKKTVHQGKESSSPRWKALFTSVKKKKHLFLPFLFLQFRIGDAGVINRFQLFLEQCFHQCNVLECSGFLNP